MIGLHIRIIKHVCTIKYPESCCKIIFTLQFSGLFYKGYLLQHNYQELT